MRSMILLCLVVSLALVSCAQQELPAARSPIEPTTPVAAIEPSPTPGIIGATPTPDWLQTASVDGDYYVLGNPASPVRLIDYSDFF